jgi:SAM-dependent methyltransferase
MIEPPRRGNCQEMTRDPNTEKWVDAYEATYSQGWISRMRFMFQRMALSDFVTDHQAKILDVGCGDGRFVRTLVGFGFEEVRGVEPDARLVPDDLRERIDQGSATSLPYPDASFDCIYFFNVLHHLNDLDEYGAAMNEAHRCLKPSGLLIFLEPDKPWFYKLLYWVTWFLSPLTDAARSIHTIVADEKIPLAYFFANRGFFSEFVVGRHYGVLRDRHLMHQWIHVARRP